MKFTKTEKIWLAVVILFFVLYNLPFVPKYNHSVAAIVHALITLIPLWIAVYVGLVKVCRIYRLREDSNAQKRKEEASSEEPTKRGDHIC